MRFIILGNVSLITGSSFIGDLEEGESLLVLYICSEGTPDMEDFQDWRAELL